MPSKSTMTTIPSAASTAARPAATSSYVVTFTLNGVSKSVTPPSMDMPLLWALRDLVGLTGTKYGCGIEVCGACTVLVNGKAEKSCDMSIGEASGQSIMTIEGIANDPQGKLVQAAWNASQVPQCGFCQSGMIISATAALKAGMHGQAIANSISNVCVCGTYQRIKDAVSSL